MKQKRLPLSSPEIMLLKEKFGRPGKSGRKRLFEDNDRAKEGLCKRAKPNEVQ